MNMKMKKIIASGLMLSLAFASVPVGFAESIDLQYAQMLSQKMSSMTDAEKKKYEDMLQVALYDTNTIQATMNSIDSRLSASEKAALESKGITNNFIMSSLQSLKSWSQEDRFALINSAKSNDLTAVERLNNKNVASSTNTGNTGAGTVVTPPVTEPTNPASTPSGTVATPPSNTVTTPTNPAPAPTPSTGTPSVTTPSTTPSSPVTAVTQPSIKISDDALDQLLNSPEFKELINLENEDIAKGSINSIANDSVVYTIRKGIEKSDFNLPEEIKNISTLVKVSNPKAVALKLDFMNLLVKGFADQKAITAHTKIQSIKDIGTLKATQINVSFLLQEGIIKKDSKGNVGATAKLTRRDAAELSINFLKAMDIEMAKDSKKQGLMKDISKLKIADQELMNKMLTAGFMSLDKTGKIGPSMNMTQGEISILVKKVYDYYLKNYGL